MDTDINFKTFINIHLGEQSYNRLISGYEYFPHSTFSTKMATEIFPEAVSILIEKFLADLSFEEASKYVNASNGIDPLIFCCADLNLIKRVIKYIPDINICNSRGNSALMYACKRPSLNIVKFLLDCGANVNTKNDANETALMCLCGNYVNYNIEQAIELLIFCGADPSISSVCGRIAYDYVTNKSALSVRSQQLLRGEIRMNNTKRAN